MVFSSSVGFGGGVGLGLELRKVANLPERVHVLSPTSVRTQIPEHQAQSVFPPNLFLQAIAFVQDSSVVA